MELLITKKLSFVGHRSRSLWHTWCCPMNNPKLVPKLKSCYKSMTAIGPSAPSTFLLPSTHCLTPGGLKKAQRKLHLGIGNVYDSSLLLKVALLRPSGFSAPRCMGRVTPYPSSTAKFIGIPRSLPSVLPN